MSRTPEAPYNQTRESPSTGKQPLTGSSRPASSSWHRDQKHGGTPTPGREEWEGKVKARGRRMGARHDSTMGSAVTGQHWGDAAATLPQPSASLALPHPAFSPNTQSDPQPSRTIYHFLTTAFNRSCECTAQCSRVVGTTSPLPCPHASSGHAPTSCVFPGILLAYQHVFIYAGFLSAHVTLHFAFST